MTTVQAIKNLRAGSGYMPTPDEVVIEARERWLQGDWKLLHNRRLADVIDEAFVYEFHDVTEEYLRAWNESAARQAETGRIPERPPTKANFAWATGPTFWTQFSALDDGQSVHGINDPVDQLIFYCEGPLSDGEDPVTEIPNHLRSIRLPPFSRVIRKIRQAIEAGTIRLEGIHLPASASNPRATPIFPHIMESGKWKFDRSENILTSTDANVIGEPPRFRNVRVLVTEAESASQSESNVTRGNQPKRKVPTKEIDRWAEESWPGGVGMPGRDELNKLGKLHFGSKNFSLTKAREVRCKATADAKAGGYPTHKDQVGGTPE